MDILEMVENSFSHDFLIENHPAKDLDNEKKLSYMYGLALMMNVDKEIHEREREYLEVLLKAFELNDTVDSFVEFAQNPEQKIVNSVMSFLKDFELKKQFLFDAIVLLKVDNVEKECELQLLKMFTAKAELLQKDIKKLFNSITNIITSAEQDELTLQQMIKRVYHPLNLKLTVDADKNWISPKSQMEFIFVEGGTFQMGSNINNNEKPIHEVNINYDFWCGKYPVTQDEYKKIMGYSPSGNSEERLPVSNVSWHDAVRFCQKLTEEEQFDESIPKEMEYRLLTEAEWEFCAKGGNKSIGYIYSGSDDVNRVAWHNGNSDNKRHPVGEKEANELGIYDMSGNVREYCSDCWHDNYNEALNDGSHWHNDDNDNRLYRGGGFKSAFGGLTVACRSSICPSMSYIDTGFRVALVSKNNIKEVEK